MAFKVKFYTIKNKLSTPEYQSLLFTTKNDTFVTFRVFFEDEGLVNFAFDFWIQDDKKCLLERFERFNIVGEEVFVIRRRDFNPELAKKRRSPLSAQLFLILNVLYQHVGHHCG
jgi:hypothetical protein